MGPSVPAGLSKMRLKSALEGRLQTLWYSAQVPPWSCRSLSLLYGYLAKQQWRKQQVSAKDIAVNVPIIVVGNITVGGTGKTPVTDWLCTKLKAHGWRPGIVTRGYGGKLTGPHIVGADDTPHMVGDEPHMLAARGHRVCIAKRRLEGVNALISGPDRCNIVVADDGLQHYALPRDIELAVVDGCRRFGNGYLLPAGPLREPVERLDGVDHVICNGGRAEHGEWQMVLQSTGLFDLRGRQVDVDGLGDPVRAIAGIGHPDRFFDACRRLGVEIIEHPRPDHHAYTESEVAAWVGPVMTTEKDATKLRSLTDRRDIYWLKVQANLPDALWQQIMQRLGALDKAGEPCE